MANTFKFGNGNWAVKKDSVLAYNDENNNFKPLAFDFTRDTIGTYVDSDGLIKTAASGEARIDYLDNANGHLLLEPARTNDFPYSNEVVSGGLETFTTGDGNITTTNNYSISPDGTQNAIRIQATITDSSSNRAGLRDVLAQNTNNHTLSFYAKSNTSSSYNMMTHFLGTPRTAITVTPEWQRFTFTEASSTSNFQGLEIRGGSSGSSLSVDISVFGFQSEEGSYATSYIPTTNGQSVTRAADLTIGTVTSNVIGQSEGVLYFEGSYFDTSEQGYIELSDGGNANRIVVWNVTSTSLRAFLEVGDNTQASITGGSISSNTIFKFAFKYKTNDFALWVNGLKYVDTNGSTFGNNVLNQLDLQVSNVEFKGEVKEIKLYDTALTDAELATLTT